jgi:peptide/nickel transport system permease protein
MRSPFRNTLWLFTGAVLVAWLAPMVAPYGPTVQLDPIGLANRAPYAAHLLGTDSFSRDVLSRLLHGARVSLGIAAGAVALSLVLGTIVGAVAALAGGALDALLMRATDVALAFPRVLLVLLMASLLGDTPAPALAVLLGATGWMGSARLVRLETKRLLATAHVRAARTLGLRTAQLWWRHVLPGLLPSLAAAATIAFAAAIPLEAGLSFLGLGVRPPDPSWGNIIADAEGQLLRRWWLVLFPTVCIVACAHAAHRAGERLVERRGSVAERRADVL